MKDDISVSISCITYNHEKYISDAIESFLMQKTSFNFEILIYDDASTDGTADIIREYERKYPSVIKPIYQIENQYSKGKRVARFNFERAKGKYIADCEGDDYWTDPEKLQKQFDFMESHQDYSMCVHNAYIVNKDKEIKMCHNPTKRSRKFSTKEIIYGGGGLFVTSSMFARAEYKNLPAFYDNAPVGDYPYMIWLSLQGNIYYMNECMSAYRVGLEGSWTNREVSTIDKKKSHYNQISNMLDEINLYTQYKYNKVIEKTKKKNEFSLLLEEGKINEIKKKEYRQFHSKLLRIRLSHYMKNQHPHLFKVLKNIKGKLLNGE